MEEIFRILLVDDEANILASLKRHLYKQKNIEVHTAQNGQQGLDTLAEKGPFAVLVSDYKMPGMDGAEFLSRAQKVAPETTRVMLTGNAEMDVALNAINRGSIYRFLLKPITPEDFLGAVQTGIDQYILIKTKEELMAELAVMQDIDRELNTTLDIRRAMTITLEWAIRQSAAAAGFVGAVYEEGIHIMAQQGFGDLLQAYQKQYMDQNENPLIKNTIELGSLQVYEFSQESKGFLPGSHSQVITPIRRENHSIGILYLEIEQTTPITKNILGFLSRLSEHASISISNAQLLAAAQAANQAKTEFISFASHELRNPLTSIGGFTELLMMGSPGKVNDTQIMMLQTIRDGVQRMVSLLQDLSDISRIETGQLRLDLKPFNLCEVVQAVVRSQRPMIDAKKQTIEVSIPENLPDIYADRSRIAQVVTNLVSNAYKYTPDGGHLSITLEQCQNQWDAKGSAQVIHFRITDTGMGIGSEDQKKIFQKFFRTVDAASSGTPGTGLGLNITRNLIEKQGGRIWFESRLHEGTTFHFTIPVA